jgi:cytochrome c oxidase cbb3-type subunit 3
MRSKWNLAAAALLLLTSIAVRLSAQGGPPPPPAGGQAGGAQGGQAGGAQGGRAGGRGTFPAQQRALADPAVLARGKSLYEISCRACHGPDLRGGDMGGPNLLRSQLALNDQDGEVIVPIIRTGRPNMDPVDMSVDDGKAVAAYIRSVLASARGQGSPPAGPPVTLNILVGDATAGQAYFAARCSSCHSPGGDLSGIGSRFSDPMLLQNLWVSGGGGGGRGGRGGGGGAAPAPSRREVTVTITHPSGQKLEGRLVRIDDFLVIVGLADGVTQSVRRDGDVPKVEIHDPLAQHKKLLLEYTDRDIHNVTAYLVTLK